MADLRKFWLTLPMIGGIIGILVWTRWGDPWSPMRISGLSLMAAGFPLLALARVQLGKSFSGRAYARALVTHGIYSRIRNPIYVFGIVVIVGLIFFYEKPIYLLGFLVIIPIQIVRARTEARVLEQAFGEAYRDYRAKTWF